MAGEKSNVPRKLLSSAIAALLAGGGAGAVDAQEAGERVLEEVTVTGSRIRAATGFETPQPVTSLTADELDDFEPGGTLHQQLSALPQFFENRTMDQASGETRYSPAGNRLPFLNLRNLGGERTLVMMDGHRLQPSSKDGIVTAELLPSALMRSVDVVTGGASAAYGADAVGGVVNFILDREFEGLRFNAGAGSYQDGVGENWQVGIAGGMRFADGRLHVIGSYERTEKDEVRSDRNAVSNFRRWGWVRNPEWSPGADVPQRLILPDVVSTQSSPTGLINAPGTPLHRMQFNLEGTDVVPFVLGDVVSLPGQSGGTNSMSGGPEAARAYQAFANSPQQGGVVTEALFAGLKFDATERLSLIFDGRLGYAENTRRDQRLVEFQTPFHMLVAADNAFLPENVRQSMIDNDIEELVVSKVGTFPDRAEIGDNQRIENQLEQWEVSGGFEYQLGEGTWLLEGHYQRGRSKPESYGMAVRLDRRYLAMDAVLHPETGEIVCRVQLFNPTPEQLRAAVPDGAISSVPLDPRIPAGVEGNTRPLQSPIGLDNTIEDCVPLNPFGNGNMSQEARDYVVTRKDTFGYVDQEFAEVLLTGEVFDNLPFGALNLAAGLTWRDQGFEDRAFGDDGVGVDGLIVNVDELGPPLNAPELGIRGMPTGVTESTPNLHAFSTVPWIAGDADVWEWFLEMQAPVWEGTLGQDRGFEQQLNLNVAYRQSDYSRSGVADSWKAALDFRFHRDWRVRVTRSRDIREPNFRELFNVAGGHVNVNDPRFNGALVLAQSLTGGNPELEPEKGDTLTTGIVWQPTFAGWLDGLQVALDWYDIQITDRVATIPAQRIVDQCEATGALCNRLERDANGVLTWVFINNLNLAEARVKGADIEVSWQAEPNVFDNQSETFSLRFLGARLDESSTTPFEGEPQDVAGVLGTPKYSSVLTANYGVGPYFFQLQNRFVDATTLDANWVEGVDVDNNRVSSMTWWNARIGYRGQTANGANWSVNLNVQNMFDEEPPVVPGFSTRGASQAFHNSFDIYGRRYNLNFNYSF